MSEEEEEEEVLKIIYDACLPLIACIYLEKLAEIIN
jgi:hypothetical protein